MTYNAGAIEATATVNLKPFREGLEQAKRDAREFERRKVTAKLDVDTAEADRKVTTFEGHVRRSIGKTPSEIVLGTSAANAKLAAFRTRLDSMRADVRKAIDVNVNDERAKARLAALDISLRRLGNTTARPRIDVRGITSAELAAESLQLRLDAINRGGGGGGGAARGFLRGLPNPSWRSLGVAGALPLVPGAAGLAAAGGASFLTPATAGLIGLGGFGAAAKGSITTVNKDVSKLDALVARYNTATTDKQRAAVLAKEQQLWASLDAPQRAAVKNVQGLDATWARFQKRLEPQTFGALAGGAKVAKTGLNLLLPSSRTAGDSVIGQEAALGQGLRSPFSRQFFGGFLPGETELAIGSLGITIGHFLSGTGHLIEAFAPLGHDLEGILMRLSSRFDTWTQGSGPQKFVVWAEREGPQAAQALEGLAHALVGIGHGFAPIASLEMQALTPVLNFIGTLGKQNPAVLTAIAGGYLAIAGSLKAMSLVNSVRGGVTGSAGGLSGVGKFGIGVSGGLGAFVAGQAGKGHGAGGAALGLLGGAASGALAGAAIGGAPGAAIGAVGGAAVSLVSHFLNLGSHVDDVSARLAVMSNNLADVIGQDKGKFGGSTKAYVENYLQQHPALLSALAKAGVGEGQLAKYLQTGGFGFATAKDAALAKVLGSSQGGALWDLQSAYANAQDVYQNLQQVKHPNTKYPGMPPGWHPPMKLPGTYTGDGSEFNAISPRAPAAKYPGMPPGWHPPMALPGTPYTTVPKGATDSVHNYDAALAHLAQTLKGIPGLLPSAAAGMKAGGFAIGRSLKQGILLGYQQTHGTILFVNAKATATGGVSISHVRAQLAAGGPAEAGSTYLVGEHGPELFTPRTSGVVHPNSATPSLGARIGREMAAAFGAQAPVIARLFAQHLSTSLASRLDSARQQRAADVSSRSQFAANLAGQFAGGLNLAGAIGPSGNVGNLSAYIGNYAGSLKTLGIDEKKLRGKHLSPGLLDMIAQVAAQNGPAAGIALATSILSGHSGSVNSLNRNFAAVGTYAGRAAGQDAAAQYAATLAKDDRMIELLTKLVTFAEKNPSAVAAAIDTTVRGVKTHGR